MTGKLEYFALTTIIEYLPIYSINKLSQVSRELNNICESRLYSELKNNHVMVFYNNNNNNNYKILITCYSCRKKHIQTRKFEYHRADDLINFNCMKICDNCKNYCCDKCLTNKNTYIYTCPDGSVYSCYRCINNVYPVCSLCKKFTLLGYERYCIHCDKIICSDCIDENGTWVDENSTWVECSKCPSSDIPDYGAYCSKECQRKNEESDEPKEFICSICIQPQND